jgi:hypothetical protein
VSKRIASASRFGDEGARHLLKCAFASGWSTWRLPEILFLIERRLGPFKVFCQSAKRISYDEIGVSQPKVAIGLNLSVWGEKGPSPYHNL